MPTETHQTFDQQGNLVASQTVEIAPEEWNRRQLFDKAKQALAVNATHLARPSPTVAQNTAQIKALTRQVNGLIRLLLNELQDISDT